MRNRIRINKLAYDRIVLNEQNLYEIGKFLDGIKLSEQQGNIFSITEGVVTIDTSFIQQKSVLDFYFSVDDDYSVLIIGLRENGEAYYQGKVSVTKNGFNIHVIQKTLDHNATKQALQSSYKVLIEFLMYTHLKQSNTNIKVSKKNPFASKGENVPQKPKKARRNVVKLSKGKAIYKYDEIDSEYSNDNKRTYSRQTESWSVRGHYRTLKSGKRVWIKGYKKGNGDTKGKDYTI